MAFGETGASTRFAAKLLFHRSLSQGWYPIIWHPRLPEAAHSAVRQPAILCCSAPLPPASLRASHRVAAAQVPMSAPPPGQSGLLSACCPGREIPEEAIVVMYPAVVISRGAPGTRGFCSAGSQGCGERGQCVGPRGSLWPINIPVRGFQKKWGGPKPVTSLENRRARRDEPRTLAEQDRSSTLT